jgi:hypothetical protein
LVTKLEVNNDAEREKVAQELQKMGKAAVPGLIEIGLKNNKPDVRKWSIHTLDTIGPPDAIPAIPAIIERLKDKEELVRERAAYTLGDFGPSAMAASRELETLLQDPEWIVRNAATEALRKIDPDVVANKR